MDLIIAAAAADAEFASELEHAFGGTRLFRSVNTTPVVDESSLAALIGAASARDVLFLVIVSRAFVEGVKSLVALDEVLGTRVDGRPTCLVVARSGAVAPPTDAEAIWMRRDAIREIATAAEVAREFVARVTAAEEPRARVDRSDSWWACSLPLRALFDYLSR